MHTKYIHIINEIIINTLCSSLKTRVILYVLSFGGISLKLLYFGLSNPTRFYKLKRVTLVNTFMAYLQDIHRVI